VDTSACLALKTTFEKNTKEISHIVAKDVNIFFQKKENFSNVSNFALFRSI